MRIIDFVYYLGVKAYMKGNKDSLGSFFITSLWFSLLQFMWFFVLMTSIELFIIKNKLEWINDIYNFVMAIAFFVILNQIYLILNKRKDKILSLNTIISEKKERYYWIFLTILFFISFILAGYFGYLRKEYFG